MRIPSLALFLTAAALGAPLLSHADDAKKPFVPKHQSVFLASPSDHNPFWPIGWIKPETDNSSTAQGVAPVVPHAADFLVTTIMLNEPPLAVINGKEMAEGEVATMPVNGQPTTVQLVAVQDGQVVIRWQNQNIVVPLHRNEEISKGDVLGATALR